MSNLVKRIIAIAGLVFMAIFSVSFVLFLFDTKMGGGVVAFITLISGICGLISFLIIKLNQTAEKEKEGMLHFEEQNNEKEGENLAEQEELKD